MSEIFVIQIETDGLKKYLSYDEQSGGYPYWTPYLFSAHPFITIELAQEVLASEYFTKSSVMANGAVYPPPMIHSGLGLNLKRPYASGKLSIQKIAAELEGEVMPIESDLNAKTSKSVCMKK